ncbi:MAG: hypothetical protein Q8R13_02650 [bacterium]|nr:hypothetical protein [bacterium]MDZ4296576.1 hypothetical protein [Patescibacteria group bacterium]
MKTPYSAALAAVDCGAQRVISRYHSFVGRSTPSSAGKAYRFSGFFGATPPGWRVISRYHSFFGATPLGWRVISR